MPEDVSNTLFPFEFTVEVEPGESISFVAGDGSDADLYVTVSDLVRAGSLDEALQVAQKIKDVSQNNQALRQIVSAYKEAGQLEQALEVAYSITETLQSDDTSLDEDISSRDNALSEIAKAYVEAGQLEQALQVAENVGEDSRVVILLDIAEKYRVAGQPDRAATVIDRAVVADRTAAKPDSTDAMVAAYLKLLSLSRFANEYAAVGREEQAVELSSEMFDVAKTLPLYDYITLTVLSNTAEFYASVGQTDKAAQVLSYSLSSVENIKETFVKALVLAQIANGYAVLEQPDCTTELLSQALELTELEKGVSEKNIVLIVSARAYGLLGQYNEALQVTSAVEPASLRDQVQQTLVCSREVR
jgi:tetratricopeptide (TPR) repeat protein